MKLNLFSALFASALVLPIALRAGDDASTASVKLADPTKPSVIRFYIPDGAIKVIGTDSPDTISVETDAQADGKTSTRPDGLRVIGGAGTFSLTENHNVVELKYGRETLPGGAPGNFTVQVPKVSSIELKNGWNSDVQVKNIQGDVEIKNVNGNVRLNDLGGGAVVETINGEIHGSFIAEPMQKSLSFTSINGRVEIHLPANAKANVRFRTQNGTILTDFSDEALKTKSEPMNDRALDPLSMIGARRSKVDEKDRAKAIAADDMRLAEQRARARSESADLVQEVPEKPEAAEKLEDPATPELPTSPAVPAIPAIPAVVGGRVVAGTLNGGGVEIQIATMNGDIIVRKQTSP